MKSLFFVIYKIIDNINTAGHWFCFCYRCQGRQTINGFLKGRKRYCLIRQFQDRFSLYELHQIKRDLWKLTAYVLKIMEHVFEIKQELAYEENFWERGIHYIVVNGLKVLKVLNINREIVKQNGRIY